MSTYPWGPHGPQAGPNEVTPNPTPAYVPPPSTDSSWGAPAPSYGTPAPSYGGGGGVVVGYAGPRKKGYITAILLSAIFGPFGLFYATGKGALVMLLALFGYPVALVMLGQPPGAYEPGLPISIWGNDAVMAPLWTKAVVCCVVWAIFAVAVHNRSIKAK